LAISHAIKLVPVVSETAGEQRKQMAIEFNTKDVKTRTKRIRH
jgi:hypothetical protein